MRKPITAPQLFAGQQEYGPAICFYCCGNCEQKNPANDIVKSSFTGLDTVTLSPWVCDGCIAAMQEKTEIDLIDGEVRSGQKIRGYSWVIREGRKLAATVQFNKARGVHKIDLNAELVKRMVELGMADIDICKQLGIDADELLRMKRNVKIADIYKDMQFSKSWEVDGPDTE